jgi:hypothetical protein
VPRTRTQSSSTPQATLLPKRQAVAAVNVIDPSTQFSGTATNAVDNSAVMDGFTWMHWSRFDNLLVHAQGPKSQPGA